MYRLSRVLLSVVLLVAGACCVLITKACWPAAAACAAFIYYKTAREKTYSAHGSACWESEHRLRRAGMVGGTSGGLCVGRLADGQKLPWMESLFAVLGSRFSDKDACELFIRRFWQSVFRLRGEKVRLAHAVHTAVFGPTGAGKGASFIVPWLLETDESAVVLDYKGENASISAAQRQKLGHCVVLLDPFNVVTSTSKNLNPLDFIDKDSPTAIDDCRDLAEQLVVRTGEEREPHWNDAAELWIAATCLAVVLYGKEGNRSLQTVRDVLSNPDKIPQLIQLLCQHGGMAARIGSQLAYFRDKELSSTLTTANRHLRFLDTTAIAAVTSSSSFNPALLRAGKLTVYVILPPEHMRAQAAWIRMVIASLMRSVVQGGLRYRHKVHFILDEAASLGPMGCINDAIDKYRGYGIRLKLFYQSPFQLKECFPNGQDQTVLANMTQVFFSINDSTADYVSSRLGDATIAVPSGGGTTGYSMPDGFGSQGQSTVSGGTSSNWSLIGRRLLRPEELYALNERVAITFAPGRRPILTTLERYYERRRSNGLLSESDVLTHSICLLLMVIGSFAQCSRLTEKKHGSPQRYQEFRARDKGRAQTPRNPRFNGTGKRAF